MGGSDDKPVNRAPPPVPSSDHGPDERTIILGDKERKGIMGDELAQVFGRVGMSRLGLGDCPQG